MAVQVHGEAITPWSVLLYMVIGEGSLLLLRDSSTAIEPALMNSIFPEPMLITADAGTHSITTALDSMTGSIRTECLQQSSACHVIGCVATFETSVLRSNAGTSQHISAKTAGMIGLTRNDIVETHCMLQSTLNSAVCHNAFSQTMEAQILEMSLQVSNTHVECAQIS